MVFRWILLLVVCTTFFSVSSASKPSLTWRLPKNLKPHHYELTMAPGFYNFLGKVVIHMTVEKQTKFIVVHAEKLNISSTNVFVNKTIELRYVRAFANETYNYWVVETERLMAIGTQIKLELFFGGQLSDRKGVFWDGYFNETTGQYYSMVATSFWPFYSRLAFPNFDEPFFKSTFTVKIRHRDNYTAVSNMPETESYMIDTVWRETVFRKTPPMNSFLVSFVVSNLPYRNNTLPGEYPLRVWGRSDRLADADFTLNMTPVIQHYLNKELPLIYPPHKLDQFAMPQSNVLNSWGLITCLERELLFDPIRDGEQERLNNFGALAFQLAYNHIGNLVTCRNWDHVWLNLGLATFYKFKSSWAADPIMEYREDLHINKYMVEDATINSRPLVTYASNATFSTDHFPQVIYYKGAAVLRMMEGFLGVRPLRRGIRRFIKNNTFSTVVTQHLWDSIQEEIDTNLNISEIMKTWVHSMGFPVINIQILPDNKINATQKRFLTDALEDLNNPPSKHGYKWYVPLTYQTKGGNTGLVWMNTTDAVFDNLLSADDDWILFNYDQSGYYRVNYDSALWDRITEQLIENHTVFTERQRSKLLSDSINLAKAGQLGYDVVLGLTRYAGQERSPHAWYYIWKELAFITKKLGHSDASYQSYVLNLTANIMDELQVVDEGSSSEKLLRPMIMLLSCLAGHKGCRENTTRLLNAWIQNETNVVPENLKGEVKCFGMILSLFESNSSWNAAYERYITAQSEKYRVELRKVLFCMSDQTLVDKLMDFYISNVSRTFMSNDFKAAALDFASQDDNSRYLWSWIKLHHQEVINRYTKHVLIEIINKVRDTFDTAEERAEVTEFLQRLENAGRQKKNVEKRDFLSDVGSTIHSSIRWLERNIFATITSWFKTKRINLKRKK